MNYLFKQVYQNFQSCNYLQCFLTATLCSIHWFYAAQTTPAVHQINGLDMPCPITSIVDQKLGCFAFFNYMRHPAFKHCFLNVCAFLNPVIQSLFYYVRSSRGLCCKILDFVHPQHVQPDHQISHRDRFNVWQQLQLYGNKSQTPTYPLFTVILQ